MTKEQLAEIRARADEATPGPWRVSSTGYSVKSQSDDMPIVAAVPGGAAADKRIFERGWLENAEFIAAARADVPALVGEVERLCDEAATLRMMRDVDIDKLNEYIDKTRDAESEVARLRAEAEKQRTEERAAILRLGEKLARGYGQLGNTEAQAAIAGLLSNIRARGGAQ